MDFKNITAKNMHFRLQEGDINEKTLGTLKKIAQEKKINHVMMTRDGNLILSGDRKIKMRNGERTLQSWLGTEHLPLRVKDFDPLPDSFLQQYFAEGYNAEKVMYKIGKKFEEAVINKLVKEKVDRAANKKRNEEMLQSDACDLVERGTINMEKVRQIEESKKFYEKLKSRQALNPDLEEKYNITFQHRVEGQLTSDFPPVTLTIERQPCEIKKKHYYIYSHLAGFGKTYEMHQFAQKYNAALITNTNNWIDVLEEAQFLIFDELGKMNKLDFEQLKSLTGGYGMMSGNCKSYGSNFKPRQDVQVIITSNKSPYDTYGEWDNNFQRKIMSADTFSQLQDRFHIIRLDGDILDDQIKYLDPIALTDEQFSKACSKQVTALAIRKPVNRARLLTDRDSKKDYLEACYSAFKSMYSMWLSRHANAEVVEKSIKYMLDELDFGPILVDTVQTYFIQDRKFLTGKHLADKIDEFLSMTDAKERIKMLLEDVDKEAGIQKNNKRPLEDVETCKPNKKHTDDQYWASFSYFS